MIQAEKATGDDAKADLDLTDQVFNPRHDELPPIDLPQRTTEIVRDKDWGTNGARPRPRRTG